MSRPGILALAGVVLLGCWLAGCAARPQTRVEPLQTAEASPEAVVLRFALIATNTGETELPLRSVDYSLELDGRRVFQGRRSAEATLSRQGEQRIVLPVPVKRADLAGGPMRYRLRGELGYTLPGIFVEALFEAGLYRPDVGFALDGEFDPSGLPEG
ncbi:MAG: LEA type 2 family protein [Planctomycetota bacterium]